MLERVWRKGNPLTLLVGMQTQLLWKAVWRFLKNLEIELPYDPAIPLLGIHTLQYSCLKNSMDRGDWQATIHEVAKTQT